MIARLEARHDVEPVRGELPATAGEALEQAGRGARAQTHGVRFIDRRERATFYSWARLAEDVEVDAANLASVGVEPGDRVALVYRTGYDFFRALFACQVLGAVPVPLYPPGRLAARGDDAKRMAVLVTAVGARLILVEGVMKSLLSSVAAGARPGLGLAALDVLSTSSPTGLRLDRERVDPRGLGLIQFSSGSTGDPKPVALSHDALMQQAQILSGFWPDAPDQEQSGVSWLPLYHDMGLIGCVWPALLRAANLTLLPPEYFVARPGAWLRTIARYGATVSPAPSFAFSHCVRHITDDQLEDVDLSRWTTALNGAECVAPAVIEAFSERFAPWGFSARAMTPVYGLAEAALAVTFSDLERVPRSQAFCGDELARGRVVTEDRRSTRTLVSVGRPVSGFAVEIRDDSGAAAAWGEVGQVWARGPSLMNGYFERPDLDREVLRDGWLDTGDRGFVWDEELWIVGRDKDMIVLSGANWAAEPIEAAVEALDFVRTGGVAATSLLLEDGEREELIVLAELHANACPDAGVAEICRQAVLVATGLRVDHVRFLEAGSLPRTSSGKLRRSEARELFGRPSSAQRGAPTASLDGAKGVSSDTRIDGSMGSESS